jgi:glucosamine 6-phosphate synthetase-like amidotransferase/phosphosugar isomerase protein
MSEQNPLQAAIHSIHQSDFAAAKDHVHDALYTKAKELVQIRKQEVAATLVNQEVNDGGEARSGQG